MIYIVRGDSSLDGDIPSMQVHVTSLDPFDTHCSQSSEVLSQSNRDHDLCHFTSTGISHNPVGIDVRGIS